MVHARRRDHGPVHGWHVEAAYFGPGGKPLLGRHLYARKVDRYDADSNVVDESYFGIDGTPVLSDAGYAREAKEYDEFGRITGWAYFGVLGEPVIGTTEFYHRASLKLDERGNRIEISVFGIDQRLIVSSFGHAKRVTRYNDWNRAIDEAYFGLNGEPLADEDRYARITILRELHAWGRSRSRLFRSRRQIGYDQTRPIHVGGSPEAARMQRLLVRRRIDLARLRMCS
jgi:hypothetical protein